MTKPYFLRNKPLTPGDRPPYQGSNPISDIWSLQAIEYAGKYFLRSVLDSKDLEAKGFMMLSATLAGIGFGSAGVHIPHACAYPIAGLKHSFKAKGYKTVFVPHGISVFVTAPASGETVVLRRNTAKTQATDYVANDPFPAETHESALDKLTIIGQDLQEQVDRSLKLSRTNFTPSSSESQNLVILLSVKGNIFLPCLIKFLNSSLNL